MNETTTKSHRHQARPDLERHKVERHYDPPASFLWIRNECRCGAWHVERANTGRGSRIRWNPATTPSNF